MPSAPEFTSPAGHSPSGSGRDLMLRWMSKLHYYLGLYLLFFIWLFAFTGLLLNHPTWKFAEFWPNRQQSSFEREIVPPAPGSDLSQADALMRQLEIRGEIEWTETRGDATQFNFRVSRPGHIYEIKTNLSQRRAKVQQIDLNTWGVMHLLHTFTGVRINDRRNHRDWALTTLWALAMDGVAVGLILSVVSSLWMWWRLPRKRLWGALALASGSLLCALFCFGLRYLF